MGYRAGIFCKFKPILLARDANVIKDPVKFTFIVIVITSSRPGKL